MALECHFATTRQWMGTPEEGMGEGLCVSRDMRVVFFPLYDVYRTPQFDLLGRLRRRKLGSLWVVVLRAALRTPVCLTFSNGEEFRFIA